MGLSVKDAETERLVRMLAERRGTGVTGAIRLAVSNELARDDEARAREVDRKLQAIRDVQTRLAALPESMSAEEIDAWMYDDNGLPH